MFDLRLDGAERERRVPHAEGVFVHMATGRPAVEAAAARHGLDLDALLGVGHTAVANPNRTVILEILQEQPA